MNGAVLERRAIVRKLLLNRTDALVVSGLGSSTWDVYAAGDDPRNFYLWGAMGSAAMIGLGLAIAQAERPVIVITGDGEMLMGLGSLATIAVAKPSNLSIVVLDNEHYGETGMQQSHTGFATDLAGVARECGIQEVYDLKTDAEVTTLAERIHQLSGPGLVFATIKVATGDEAKALPIRDGVEIKNRFMQSLHA